METKQPFRETGIFHINGQNYDLEKLTFAQVRSRYGTGRAFVISGTGRDRKYGYRTGCMTEIGDIELSQWMDCKIGYTVPDWREKKLSDCSFNSVIIWCP